MSRYLLFCLLALLGLNACLPEEKPVSPAVEAGSAPAQAKPAPAKPAKPKTPETACQVNLTAPREKVAEEYYVKGERLVNSDEIKAAKQALETALCLNPKHKQAGDLLKLLKKTYP